MGKKLIKLKKSLDQNKEYSLIDAISLLKEVSYVKFDETLDIAIHLGIDPRRSDQIVRGMVILPEGTGKNVKVAVFCKEERMREAKNSGADFVDSNNLIRDIKDGKIEFDILIATPDMMGIVGEIAQILGPRGLMPNPKFGTVTKEIGDAVQNAKCGQVEYRTEKSGIIHAGIGKISFSEKALHNNVCALFNSILKVKPVGVKGTYLKKMYLSSTMSPSLKVDITTVV